MGQVEEVTPQVLLKSLPSHFTPVLASGVYMERAAKESGCGGSRTTFKKHLDEYMVGMV